MIHNAISALLSELLDGSAPAAAWILNPEDPGLLRSLDKLSAPAASASVAGGSSIAAHVDHLCYGLELLNRWSQGEDPFTDADYSASWRRTKVSDEEWTQLRQRLRDEAHRWLEAVRQPRDLSQDELTGMFGGVAHLAYHLGAIRQIDRTARGPQAKD